MFSKTLSSNIQKRIVVGVMAITMFFGMIVLAPKAQAQTTGLTETQQRLLALIAELQEKVLVLQRKQYESKYQETTNIIHANSYVEATTRVTLYNSPEKGSATGRQYKGDGGEITAGPRLVNGEVWWKVDFTDEDEGWVKEKYLVRIPSITISQDQDGDGEDDVKVRILGDYRADRIILYPHSGGVEPYYIPEDKELLKMYDDAYQTGQADEIIDGPVEVLQSNPYRSNPPFIKGENSSVPIAWQAINVPMNSEVEIQVEAVRLVDNPVSGGTWGARALVGDSVGVYYWDIEGEGRIGAGDYRSQVRIKECSGNDCEVVAESPYRYFSIRNPE